MKGLRSSGVAYDKIADIFNAQGIKPIVADIARIGRRQTMAIAKTLTVTQLSERNR
jgi:hypothetical protein